jgi:hypothetical protein
VIVLSENPHQPFGMDWNKGLRVCILVHSDKAITTPMMNKNAGWGNLRSFPYKLKKIWHVYPSPTWKDFLEFEGWLKNTFNERFDDDIFYLEGWEDGTHYCKKQRRRVRYFRMFAKFQIIDGVAVITKDMMRKSSGGYYPVGILRCYEQSEESERKRDMDKLNEQLGIGKKITLDDLKR